MFLQISLQKFGAGSADAFEFSESLVRLGFSHTVVTSEQNELRHRWLPAATRRVLAIPTFGGARDFLIATLLTGRWFALVRLLFVLRPRVVYTTHVHPWLLFVLACKPFLGYRWLHAVHENPYEGKERSAQLTAAVDRLCIYFCTTVVTHSRFMESVLRRRHRAKPFLVVPLGSYATLAGHAPVPDFSSRPLRVLFAGRLESYKGLSVLVEALEQARKIQHDIQLTVAGRGSVAPDVLARLRALGAVIEQRWLTVEEWTELFCRHQVLALPYTRATQSGAMSWALAVGMPVIATSAGALPEQVVDGHSGYIVPVGDSAVFAEKMVALARSPETLERFSRVAREMGTTAWSWDAGARHVIAWYNQSSTPAG